MAYKSNPYYSMRFPPQDDDYLDFEPHPTFNVYVPDEDFLEAFPVHEPEGDPLRLAKKKSPRVMQTLGLE